ncbi:Rho GTPase-activating protein 18 [Acropora cervicornis]|uniref:Rho GTPase-activating protein 18 n=1 Tax=Acropora cervicornis TaxID=6130 RepID=A0AAD9QEQ1_ACRCE|nr:Rho GTPase-activating protein 18 [Acropora cervicornis]
MASRIKGRGSHALDQLEYDIFWTEYRAINESRPELSEEEHEDDPQKEPPCECEQEVQWLKEAGFHGIVKKYKATGQLLTIAVVTLRTFALGNIVLPREILPEYTRGRRPRRIAWVLPRPQYWFDNLLNSNALNMWWKENFRVTRETFHFICTAVAPVIRRQDTILRAAIPVETRTAIGLWRLATGDSYRSCGLMFGIAKSTAIGVCKDFIQALCQLKDQFIKFPTCPAQVREKIQDFREKSTFPNVVGALDGTHIPIRAPKENHEDYFNRKHYYSFIVQGIVDASDSKEIDHNDVDFENITSSLTRKQAEAVRKRIDTLNESTKRKLGMHIPPSKHTAYPADVRTIFPTKTNGQPSNAEHASATRRTLQRKSYSEGVHGPRVWPLDNETCRLDDQLGCTGYRYSKSSEMISSLSKGREAYGVYLSAENGLNRRGSDDIRLGTGGVQQGRNMKGESVFFVTGTTRQELFNTAEKTKESSVDDVADLGFQTLKVSPPDSSPDSFHEVAVDCPEEIPVGAPANKAHPKKGHRQNGEVSASKPFRAPQFPRLPDEMDRNSPPPSKVLENFTLTKDELGVTGVKDLSTSDMEKVRSLSLIELTALFDSHGLALHRRKPIKKRVKESGIFGVPLQNLVQEDKLRNERVSTPIFFTELVRYLEEKGLREEGILRVPGNTGRVKIIREEMEEKFYDGTFSLEDRRPHDCATLLKQFLRELPFPLLTHEYQPAFAAVENIPDRKQQLQALNLLILLLPPIHRDCLKILVHFLSRVVHHENHNKMGLNSVAMIMAPNLFLCTDKTQPTLQEIKHAQGTVNIVRMLIKYQAILWTIPGFMVMQVRYLYEAEGNKKANNAKAGYLFPLAFRQTSISIVPCFDADKLRCFLTGAKAVSEAFARRALRVLTVTVVEETNEELLNFTVSYVNDLIALRPAKAANRVADIENNIIRVQAPLLNKVLMAIQLTEDMRAGDIVSKFRRRPSPSEELHDINRNQRLCESQTSDSYRNCLNPHNNNKFASDNYNLYEAGGNIGERRLDHDTNIMALRKVNPYAEWIVKPRD